ncbi:MAG: hypothetical protein ACOYBS_01345 [Flavobacterium sp.]
MKKLIFPVVKEYKEEVSLIQDSNRLKSSITKMKTLLNSCNITIDTNRFVNEQTIDFGEALQNIENHINTLILQYSKNPKDETLIQVFHYIHFWGGITGRGIYVKNGGFDNNFNINTYRTIVEKIIDLKQDTLCEDLKEIEKLFITLPFIGVAYGTKHMRFWSITSNKNKIELPILDSIIAKNMFDTKYFAWRHYCSYAKQMQEEAKKRKVSVTALERTLYNEFN